MQKRLVSLHESFPSCIQLPIPAFVVDPDEQFHPNRDATLLHSHLDIVRRENIFHIVDFVIRPLASVVEVSSMTTTMPMAICESVWPDIARSCIEFVHLTFSLDSITFYCCNNYHCKLSNCGDEHDDGGDVGVGVDADGDEDGHLHPI